MSAKLLLHRLNLNNVGYNEIICVVNHIVVATIAYRHMKIQSNLSDKKHRYFIQKTKEGGIIVLHLNAWPKDLNALVRCKQLLREVVGIVSGHLQ